VHCS
jgi:hypothetical protein